MSDMDIEISTKKINMTLDEIIKQNKKGVRPNRAKPTALKKQNSTSVKKNNTNNNTNQNKSNGTKSKLKIKKTGLMSPKKELQAKRTKAISPDNIKIRISNAKAGQNNAKAPGKSNSLLKKKLIKKKTISAGGANRQQPSTSGDRIVKILPNKNSNNNNSHNNSNKSNKTLNDRFSFRR